MSAWDAGTTWDAGTPWDAAQPPQTGNAWDSGATWDAGAWDAVAQPPIVEVPLPPPGWLVPPLYADGPLPVGGTGGDIRIIWDNTNAIGDWALAEGDILTGQDLETACLVSLFSDVLATPDFTPTDGTTDRRGWWADPYNDEPLGSHIWQLERAKKTRATLGLARTWTLDALNWLIEDGVAKQIFVNTMWLSPTMLGIAVAITKPDGTQTRFMFGWAWTGLAVVPSPVQFVNPFPPQLS